MRYVENSMKAGKPYRQRRMTNSNCAIDIEKQAKLYAEFARERGLKVIHVFPDRREGTNTFRTRFTLSSQMLMTGVKLVDVDPEEWK